LKRGFGGGDKVLKMVEEEKRKGTDLGEAARLDLPPP
jgi:hypothetical protein